MQSFSCFLVTVSVQFEEVVYSLPESRGRVMVCAEISSPAVAEREFFLNITSSDRDAGIQYIKLSHTRNIVKQPSLKDCLKKPLASGRQIYSGHLLLHFL